MAYVKTTWKTGDVITAEKLNNMEGGIEAHDPVFITAAVEDGSLVLSETYETIHTAYAAGRQIFVVMPDGSRAQVNNVAENTLILPATYDVYCIVYDEGSSAYIRMMFVAAATDDYPAYTS